MHDNSHAHPSLCECQYRGEIDFSCYKLQYTERYCTCTSWDTYHGNPCRSSHAKSFGNSLPIRASTTGTFFPSVSMEAMLGNFPFGLMMTTRCNLAEVVLLRSEANSVNSSMKSSVRLQSRNARVLSEGEEDGFENRMEKKCDTLVSQFRASVSRAGRDDG